MRKKLLGLLLLGATCTSAVAQSAPSADLADLSLEQLARLSVTSASRRPERLLDAPASIFVVTQEDIRRSGVTSIYEALRLAPNLQLVRGDASQYIATARGGLAGTANKMLVLIDGRTVYSPLFSGVFADAQFVFLEDVERIEVISGPGSTLWGTNAVNGVINVITRSAARTNGTLAAAAVGEDERGVALRHGTALGAGDVRAYVRYQHRLDGRLASGASARDEAERTLAGVRYDRHAPRGTLTTVQAEAYRSRVDHLGGFRPLSGGHVLARHRAGGLGGEWFVQGYLDRSERRHTGSFAERRDIVDVEAQHAIGIGAHRVVYGGAYRVTWDDTTPTAALAFVPEDRRLRLASLYAQGTWQASPALQATAGLRAERNDYTGLEWLPNLRATWRLDENHLVWGALTRTVRSPSRIDRELRVPAAAPFLLVPGDFRSEIAKVAEIGWRARPWRDATISLTAFHHDYDRLRAALPQGGGLVFANGAQGRLRGAEGWLDWTVTGDWRLVAGFAALRERYRLQPGHLDPPVPAYTAVDVSLAWRPVRGLERLNVSNAGDREHREFGPAASGAVFGRTAWLKATWTL